MNNYNSRSRVNKFEKRRKNTKAITLLLILGVALFFVLFMVFIFSGKDKNEDKNNPDKENVVEDNEQDDNETEQPSENGNNEGNAENDDTGESTENETSENNTSNNDDESEDIVVTDPSDENVISAFSRNWDPVKTKQSEPHVIEYGDGTQDRIEMEEAIRLATGLDEMIVWWLGRGGDQEVIATVTTKDQTEIYRVFLSWITDQGWQPAKVEILKVNDKHPDNKNNQEEEN